MLIGTAGQEPSIVDTLAIVTQSSTLLVFGWDPAQIYGGGLAITGYLVSMDEGDYVYDTITPAAASASTFSYAVTQPGNEGKTYRFRIAASNVLGTG